MTLSQRDAADEAYKQAMMQYDDERPPNPVTDRTLRPSELRTLQLTAEGMTVKEVAAECGLSHETIKRQLTMARSRLGARNTVHAVVLAVRDGQLTL